MATLTVLRADDEIPLSRSHSGNFLAYDHEANTNEYASRAVLQTAGGVFLWANVSPNGVGVLRGEKNCRGACQAR